MELLTGAEQMVGFYGASDLLAVLPKEHPLREDCFGTFVNRQVV